MTSLIKRLNTLWLIYTSLLNLDLIYYISDKYFRYGVSTNVQFDLPKGIKTLKITVCFDLTGIMKWHQLTDYQFPERKNTSDGIKSIMNDSNQVPTFLDVNEELLPIFLHSEAINFSNLEH